MPSSFFNRSALCGPTPLRYSIGLANMFEVVGMNKKFQTKIIEFTLHSVSQIFPKAQTDSFLRILKNRQQDNNS